MIYAIVPLFLAVLCAWLGPRPLSLLILFGYLAIEGFLKLVSNYSPIVHVGIDLIVLALSATVVLGAVVLRRARLPHLPWTRLILLYAFWLVLQLFNPHSAGLVPSLASFKIHLTMVPLYFLGAALFREPREVTQFLTAVAVIAMVPFGMALAQYALGPASVLDLSPRFWQNISHFHEWRPFGTSATPGGSSVYAYLAIPLALVVLVAPSARHGSRFLALLCITLAAATFVVSGVRQVFLGCVLAVLIMTGLMLSRGRGRVVAALLLVAALVFSAYTVVDSVLRPMATAALQRDPTLPDIWRERDVTRRMLTLTDPVTYLEARGNPLGAIWYRVQRYPFGAGLGRTGSAAGAFQREIAADPRSAAISRDVGWSDNFFADMIVETGVPGVVMLTLILLGMLAGAWRLARTAQDPTTVAAAAALAGFFFSILAMSWGSQPLLGNPITAYFWFLSGVLAALRRMEAEAPTPGAEAPAVEPALATAGAR